MTPTGITCRDSDDGKDACDANSICRNDSEGPHCFVAPACPANGICELPMTASANGAACNDGALPGKGRICITDRCLRDADCGTSARVQCVRKTVSAILGQCVDGSDTGGGVLTDALGWEPGCPMASKVLTGKQPAGAACSKATECAPTCCSCAGGTSASLAAKCDLSGVCASAAEACGAVTNGGGACSAP